MTTVVTNHPLLCSIGIAAAIGLAAVLEKMVFQHISPFVFLLGSCLLAGFCSAIIIVANVHQSYKKFVDEITLLSTRPHLAAAAILSVALVYLGGHYLYYLLLEKHTSYVVVSLTSIYPLFAIGFSYLLLRKQEPFSATKLLGVALIVAGVILLGNKD